MYSSKAILGMFNTNKWVIEKQTEGLSHEDSLLQLPFQGNCMNWILGHLLVSRESALNLLGLDPIWADEDAQARYKFDSDPITTDGDDVVRLERLLEIYNEQHEQIESALGSITQEQLDALTENGKQTIGQAVHFLAWHEGYHSGQLEILRQLTGVNDKVI